MAISNPAPTTGGGNGVTPNPTYASGATSITVQLSSAVDLSTGGTHTPLLVEATSGVVAPYILADLATFYEVCFVQTNTGTPLITLATTLLDIDVQKGTNIVSDNVCDDGTFYHPIVV